MHFDTRLFLFTLIQISLYSGQYSDDQSYLSLIDFHRGGNSTNLIFTSPHGGFLGANLTTKRTSFSLEQLPIAGCYNDTLKQCIYTFQDCLKSHDQTLSHRSDARCLIDRSSTVSMYLLTKLIADSFQPAHRPYTVLNKATRQFVDPAEDLLRGTFLIESATRIYIDYHRLIAMAKEAITPPTRGLLIEFVFHRNSQTLQLGYGYDPLRVSTMSKPNHTTIEELITRSGPSVILGNNSFGYFLRQQGFSSIIPLEQNPSSKSIVYRLESQSTRMHADRRFNTILFSYPIERLRKYSMQGEAMRIAKAIQQFIQINHIKSLSSSSSSFRISFSFLHLLMIIHILSYKYK